jgi:hypothetical protein
VRPTPLEVKSAAGRRSFKRVDLRVNAGRE